MKVRLVVLSKKLLGIYVLTFLLTFGCNQSKDMDNKELILRHEAFPENLELYSKLSKISTDGYIYNFIPYERILCKDSLVCLDFSNGMLIYFDGQHFPNLDTLILKNNRIDWVLNFNNLRELKLLDLSGNRLKDIGSFKIESLQNLVKLDISRNMITDIPIEFFTMPNIEEIDLRNNNISNLPISSYSHSLKRIVLSGNSLSNDQVKEIKLKLKGVNVIP